VAKAGPSLNCLRILPLGKARLTRPRGSLEVRSPNGGLFLAHAARVDSDPLRWNVPSAKLCQRSYAGPRAPAPRLHDERGFGDRRRSSPNAPAFVRLLAHMCITTSVSQGCDKCAAGKSTAQSVQIGAVRQTRAKWANDRERRGCPKRRDAWSLPIRRH
jgi:hypothetical protein